MERRATGSADIGLIGLGVMGQNLALNMASKGYRVRVYNRTVARVEEFLGGPAKGKDIMGAGSLEELVGALRAPRKVMLMVKAGPAVDEVTRLLVPLLEKGDLIIDGGNSFYRDTIRRGKELSERGLLFLGVGISGGEAGALTGPSIMAGGPKEAWDLAGGILLDVAAKVEGEPCCAHLGPDGAGHFTKMVHNGIEYGDMQLIAESYHIMRDLLGISPHKMARVFREWDQGELESYLIEITGDILARPDPETGKPLVDVILDAAEQKGTGKWTSQEALDLGMPVPTITEAVFARFISALKEERSRASEVLPGPAARFSGDREGSLETLRRALYASKVCLYAQGFALLREASEEYGWDLDLGKIALIWRGGCIIRARFLDRIKEAYEREKGLYNLLLDEYFRGVMASYQAELRKLVGLGAVYGIPLPGFYSTLAYYDSYRTGRLPQNLIQAQRDYFGAHTYRRLDRPGSFHTEWGT